MKCLFLLFVIEARGRITIERRSAELSESTENFNRVMSPVVHIYLYEVLTIKALELSAKFFLENALTVEAF